MLDAPPLADAICHDPLLSRLKLIALASDDSLLPRGGARGFPHWGVWQQRNTAFGADLMAFLAEGGTGRGSRGANMHARGSAGARSRRNRLPGPQKPSACCSVRAPARQPHCAAS